MDFIINNFKDNGYIFNEKGSFNLNIFCIRYNNRVENQYNDFLFCVFKNQFNKWILKQWEVSTIVREIPDKQITGTSILEPDQYINKYSINTHEEGYRQMALCNKGGIKLNINNNISSPHYGVCNIINNKGNVIRSNDMVFKNIINFKEFMSLCHLHRNLYGNKYTFTLFNEDKFKL